MIASFFHRIKIIIIAASLWAIIPSMVHPFYIGITEIEYKPKSKVIQVSIKLFLDDVMSEINAKSSVKFNPEKKNSTDNNRLLAEFVNAGFCIKTANDPKKLSQAKKIPMTFIGWELEEGAIWMYWESGNALQKFVSVENKLLCASVNQQIHIIKITRPGSVKTERISCSAPNCIL